MVFQIIAIVILLIFYGCYFGKMISQKKQGIQTDQIGKGKTGLVKRIEVSMKVVTILVPVVEVASILLGTSVFPNGARVAGIGIATIGVIFFVTAVWTMRDSWRAGVSTTDETKLVTRGIFQISRNPAFFGFGLVYIGILLMFFNWVLWIVSAAGVTLFHLQIVNVEEAFLRQTFGEEYLAYKRKVCRYFGRKIGK